MNEIHVCNVAIWNEQLTLKNIVSIFSTVLKSRFVEFVFSLVDVIIAILKIVLNCVYLYELPMDNKMLYMTKL